MDEKERVIAEYEARFGGFPSFLLMGATDEEIVEALSECLRTGKEMTAPDPRANY